VLLTLTLATVAAVVLVLVVYLLLILSALRAARRSVAAIADGLELVQRHSTPLPGHLTTINGGLSALLQGLRAADNHLAGVTSLLGLFQHR
jgi:hypothetical protein